MTERALLAGIRPVLVPSRMEDPPEKVGFLDDRYLRVEGGRAVVEAGDDAIYMAIALRNVGTGLAVLDRWDFRVGRPHGDDVTYRDPSLFHRLTRDLYVPAGDRGFWQGAFREPDQEEFQAARRAIDENETVTIDLLYGDHEGGQRTITRIALIPLEKGGRLAAVGRHWNLDRPDPR